MTRPRRSAVLALLALASSLWAQPTRTPWETSQVRGTPEPPAPVTSVPILPRLAVSLPIELATVPGTDRLLLVELRGRISSFSVTGDPAAAEDAARTHIEAVWLRIAEQESSNSDAESSPLKRATVHIAFRLHCPLTLSHVANKIAFTSPGNLSRLFRRHHGVSFQVYLQKLRMKKAAELLRTTRLPVARIAKRVGYNDASRFGQHFKRQLGATPIAYRIAGQS